MQQILCISGSTRKGSTCMSILATIAERHKARANFTIYTGLAALPHFDPDAENEGLPPQVKDLRQHVAAADGVIFCTPEYVFSVPAILKNAIEWCVASTVFSDKPTAMIVASGVGQKTTESLGLILQTIQTRINPQTMLLLQGVRSKMLHGGTLTDAVTLEKIDAVCAALLAMTKEAATGAA